MLKPFALVTAITAVACLSPLAATLAQQGTTGQGQAPSGTVRDPGQTGGAASGAAREMPGGTASGTTREQGQAGMAPGVSRERAETGTATDTAPGRTGVALSTQDHQFIEEAAQGGLAEVELGRLAQQKATSDAVKQFGEHMVRDHSKANQKLLQIAQQHGVTPPTEPGDKHKAIRDKLSGLSGKAFDKEYMSAMLEDHEEDVEEFEQAAKSSQSGDIKQFAQETLPTLREHLELAKSVHNQVGQ